MCDKIVCEPDGDIRELEAQVHVSFNDEERECYETITYPLGEPQNPYLQDRLRGKFMGLARSTYGNENAQQILDAVETLDQSHAADLLKFL